MKQKIKSLHLAYNASTFLAKQFYLPHVLVSDISGRNVKSDDDERGATPAWCVLCYDISPS